MAQFVGRTEQLRSLDRALNRVSRADDPQAGKCILIRGRRRVGKSRLAEEFIKRAGVPSAFFTASRQGTKELERFRESILLSDLAGRDVFSGVELRDWDAAFRLLVEALPPSPSIVVIDEAPYLMDDDNSFDATLQKMWDRQLSKKPVLLLLIGSDLAMMERLNTYGRPFYQRGTEMLVPPFSPAETGETLALDPADSIDAFLITGGLPLVLDEWSKGGDMWSFLERGLSETTSALIVSGERSLEAEFPDDAHARSVLTAIGSGERTFGNIGSATGTGGTSLTRALNLLVEKRAITRSTPLSTKPSNDTRYTVVDPYLRFWLRFVGPYVPELERGRSDIALRRIREGWESWRGRAVEPVVRDAIERLLPFDALPETQYVGSFWTRNNAVEVDLVGADKSPIATKVTFVGSIKWRNEKPFGNRDLARLISQRSSVPGARDDTPLVVVSRSGFSNTEADVSLDADDLIRAWAQAAP